MTHSLEAQTLQGAIVDQRQTSTTPTYEQRIMKRFTLTFTMLAALLGCSIAKSAEPIHKTAKNSVPEPHKDWGLTFDKIPEVLRLHVPALQRGRIGLLVADVNQRGSAASAGLRRGDVILEIDGELIRDRADLRTPGNQPVVVVLRRGTVQPLMPAMPSLFAGGFAAPNFGPPTFPGGAFTTPAGGVTASSVSGNNESVSVSRSGDQITLNMSLPDLTDQAIRLRGTINQIRQQLDSSNLPASAKQRVIQAINQNR